MKSAKVMESVMANNHVTPQDLADYLELDLPVIQTMFEDSEDSKSLLAKAGGFIFFCLFHVAEEQVVTLITTLAQSEDEKAMLLIAVFLSGTQVTSNARTFVDAITVVMTSLNVADALLAHNERMWEMIGVREASLAALQKMSKNIISQATSSDLTAMCLACLKVERAGFNDQIAKSLLSISQQADRGAVESAMKSALCWVKDPSRESSSQWGLFKVGTSLPDMITDAMKSRKPDFIRLSAALQIIAMDKKEVAVKVNRCKKRDVLEMLLETFDLTPMDVMMNPHLNEEKKTQLLEILNNGIG